MTANQRRIEYVSRGQGIRSSMTADNWNAFVNAANNFQPINTQGGTGTIDGLHFIGPQVKLNEDVEAGTPIMIDKTTPMNNLPGSSDAATENARANPILNGGEASANTGAYDNPIGVAYKGGLDGELTTLAMAGVATVKLFVPTGGDWIRRAAMDKVDKTRLVSHPGGSVEILAKGDGEDQEVWAVVRLGIEQNVQFRATTTSAVSANQSVNAELWTLAGGNTGFTVLANFDWMVESGDGLPSGSEVIVTWMPQDEQWTITSAACGT